MKLALNESTKEYGDRSYRIVALGGMESRNCCHLTFPG